MQVREIIGFQNFLTIFVHAVPLFLISINPVPASDGTDKPSFSADKLQISAQVQRETRPDYFILDGYVDISGGGLRIQADHAEYDVKTTVLIAIGNVVFDRQDYRITGRQLEMNIDTQLGTMDQVFGYVPPSFFFWGTKLDKIGENEYKLHDGIVTECSQIVPHWRLLSTTAHITLNETAQFKNFRLEAKDIPIFYSPYMIWPINRDRSTGFLFPSFGPNSEKGFWLGGAFYWAMNRSMDSTYWLDHWTLRGWGGGAEFRYASANESGGALKYYFANDTLFGPEWSLNTSLNETIPGDFRISSTIDVFSSFAYIQDAETSASRRALRQEKAQMFASNNWSYYSFNVLTDWQNYQLNSKNETQTFHLPEVEFLSRNQQLGPLPLFWTLQTSISEIGRGTSVTANQLETTQTTDTFQRIDFFPSISWPISALSWLTVTPSYSFRYTNYSAQLDSTGATFVFDESLSRTYSEMKIDLRGPNFAKVFETPESSYSKKWKHAIEPQVSLHYLQDIPDRNSILKTDADIDDIQGKRAVTYSLTNLIYAKRPIEETAEFKQDDYQYYNPKPYGEPSLTAWEFISWNLSQSLLFDSDALIDEQKLSPLVSKLRVNPLLNQSLDLTIKYHWYDKRISEISLGSTLKSRNLWFAGGSYNYELSSKGNFTHQLRSNGGISLWKNRFSLAGALDYDFETRKPFDRSLSALYMDDCFSFGIEWRKYHSTGENQFSFSFNLLNIGNLVSFRAASPDDF